MGVLLPKHLRRHLHFFLHFPPASLQTLPLSLQLFFFFFLQHLHPLFLHPSLTSFSFFLHWFLHTPPLFEHFGFAFTFLQFIGFPLQHRQESPSQRSASISSLHSSWK